MAGRRISIKPRRPARKRRGQSSESIKIGHLRKEGVPQDQAVAEALSMKREGRLGEKGGYMRAGRKRKRSSKRY